MRRRIETCSRKGERVTSILAGYYLGIPGTITRKAPVQYYDGRGTRYVVLLDTGEEVTLNERDMKPIKEQRK